MSDITISTDPNSPYAITLDPNAPYVVTVDLGIPGPQGIPGQVQHNGAVTSGNLAAWFDGTGNTIKDSGVAPSPDGTFAGNSDALIPTQKATKTYADTGDALKLAKASNLSDVANASTARTNLGVAIGSNVQAWDTDLDALAALNATAGLVSRTGAGAFAVRTLTPPAAGIGVTNGDGGAGNPTITLANDLAAVESLASTGIAVRIASDTWAQRQIAAGVYMATPTNPAGVAGDISVNFDPTKIGCEMPMLNGTFVATRATNAETIALKTLAGNDPSAADPVYAFFRSATIGSGVYVARAITAALSITIPSGQAVGFKNAEIGKLYVGFIDNAGTVEIFVEKFATTTGPQVFAYDESSLVTTVAIAAAPSAGVAYSTTARTSVAWRGAAVFEYTLATAGTWVTAPAKMSLLTSGSKKPGDVLQVARLDTGTMATGTTIASVNNSIRQNSEGDQYMAAPAITPSSGANLLRVRTQLQICNSAAGTPILTGSLFQDSVANALKSFAIALTSATLGLIAGEHLMLASVVASTTFKVRAGANVAGTTTFNGISSTQYMGGVFNSFIEASEIMA